MTNHVHLVVTPPDARSLSRCVQSFAQRYREVVVTRAAEQQRLVGVEPPETARDYELVDRRRHDRTCVA
jgi:REP element-mobilizing transposase RayT